MHQKIYLRHNEIKAIQNFLKTKKNILHVIGPPGTGKTHVVTALLKDRPHLYLNYYVEHKIFQKIKNSIVKIFCIDEYDRYENSHSLECKQMISLLSRRKCKLITISNNLLNFKDVLCFKPYSTDEIETIILQKFKDNGYDGKLDALKIKLASKRCSSGDLRLIYDELNRENSYNEVEEEENLHKKIIKDIKIEKSSLIEAYSKYIEKCKSIGIGFCSRNDFALIFDNV